MAVESEDELIEEPEAEEPDYPKIEIGSGEVLNLRGRKMSSPDEWEKEYKHGDDKMQHASAGFAGTLGLWTLGLPLWAVIVVAIVLAFSKEIWDALGNGNPDWWDFICGILGMATALVIIMVYYVVTGKKSLREDD